MTWTATQTNQVLKTIAIVCEVTASTLSEAAIRMIVRQLQRFPQPQVIKALERCANECKRGLTLADIVERVDDGRPSAEEAWARVPKSEDDAACMSGEMLIAWAAARGLIKAGDHVAARMTFREVYAREMREARISASAPVWILSPGFDRSATEAAAIDGIRAGLISVAHAGTLLSAQALERVQIAAGIKALPMLEGPADALELEDETRALVAQAVASLPAPAAELVLA
jgi:hypothetical protein